MRLLKYKESAKAGNPYRSAYLDGIDAYIQKEREKANQNRAEYIQDILSRGEDYRKDFFAMLGAPLTTPREQNVKMEKHFVTQEGNVRIYRTVTTVLGCIPVYGMLFTNGEDEKKPLVISAHGGLGTPELCSSLLEEGSFNYNDMTQRILAQDVHVYAPQFLLWDPNKFVVRSADDVADTDSMRRTRDNRLKQLGSSITAIEIYGLMCALDALEQEPYINKEQIGMAGLSYGGFYTLFTAAADTRIKYSVACCQFSDRYTYDWSDWVWFNAAYKFFDAEILALVYPRHIEIFMGDHDNLFDSALSVKEFDTFKKIAGEKSDFANLTVFKGGHEFVPYDEPIIQLANALKGF
ncbi:MAG: prolyl oligopeptidase family serine peptidase [Clostridia bacterium]|nr:prolyl oligopeptidase family serine peptidase [Clostridia bacterium]